MRLTAASTLVLMTMALEQAVVAQREPVARGFEVASLRRLDASASLGVLRITASGQLVGRSTLQNMVVLAYGLEPYERVLGAAPATSRALEDKFDINALPPTSSSPPTRKEVGDMLRELLTERFALKVRIDSESTSALVFRLIKPGVLGPGLRPAPEGCTRLPPEANRSDPRFADAYRRSCVLTEREGRTLGTMTLDEFATVMSFGTRRPIINRTGLEGMFAIDIVVDLTTIMEERPSLLGPRVQGSTPPKKDAPGFVEALRDQMGLSVRSEQQPIRLFVVEHVGPFVEN